MREDTLAYHPTLLEVLGLEDPGDFMRKAKERPDFPAQSGRTTRMQLLALHALVQGKPVFLVSVDRTYAHELEREVRDWCVCVGIRLEPNQLRSGLARAADGWSGLVLVDHDMSPRRGKSRLRRWRRRARIVASLVKQVLRELR